MDVIDWRAAQRVGELVAGSPPFGGVRSSSVEPLVREFAGRVGDYSHLEVTGELPALELVDRPGWIAANLRTMRPMLSPLTDALGTGGGPLAGPMRAASGMLMGVQVGALAGVLSQRVLGQYELSLLDPSVRPRLLLLAPNLAQAARNLGVDRDELVLWVSIHEITHAVQFGGAPWLAGHLGGILRELLEGMRLSLADGDDDGHGEPRGGGRSGLFDLRGFDVRGFAAGLPDAARLREAIERARRGELLRVTLGEERWALVERMQAAMSLIEGHAEHTMDAIGAEVLPSLERLRTAMTRRREHRGLPWRVLERLMGLELKLRQYEVGRRFCDAVVQEGGTQALARAWSGAEALPSMEELERPALWLERVGALPAGA